MAKVDNPNNWSDNKLISEMVSATIKEDRLYGGISCEIDLVKWREANERARHIKRILRRRIRSLREANRLASKRACL